VHLGPVLSGDLVEVKDEMDQTLKFVLLADVQLVLGGVSFVLVEDAVETGLLRTTRMHLKQAVVKES